MNEILQESFTSYKEYLEKMPNGCQSIADLLREDRTIEAGKSIGYFTEGMIWVLDMNKLLVKEGVVKPLKEEVILDYLSEVNNGLQIQDFVLVADMFEYEIKPFFELKLEELAQ